MGEIVGAAARKSQNSLGLSLAEGIGLATAGRLDEARAYFERMLAHEPRNADVCNNLGVLHIQRGDMASGAAMLDRAFRLNPHDAEIRGNAVRANLIHANAMWSQQQFAEAIAGFRRVLRYDPGNSMAMINLVDALGRTGVRAERGDFVPNPAVQAGTHMLIACMPKSGSTFLLTAVQRLTGWTPANFAYAYFQNEQELYLPYLLAVDRSDTVTQQHCRATIANVQILQGFGIRPVVLVRNLPDIVMSLVDFYDSGAVINTFFASDWHKLGAEAKRDLIIDHVMPWYVNFYVSWRQAMADGRLDCLFIRYEDMIADKPGTLARISDFLGLAKTADECRSAVAKAEDNREKIRFNRGVAGRGAATLTADQFVRLRRLASYHPSIDFAPIGL
jgi:tetratricopeptide (TPR) repeat protein